MYLHILSILHALAIAAQPLTHGPRHAQRKSNSIPFKSPLSSTSMCLVKYFIHYPANLGNHKGVFPHQFHFFFLLEGGERMNENANKLYQGISKHFFSSSIGKAEPKVQSSCLLSQCRCSEVQLFTTLCSLGRTAQWEQKLQSQCAWVCILDPSLYYRYDSGACDLTSPRLFSCL